LKHLSRRLISRLGAGLVVRVEPLRERGRRRFARELCKENGVAASPALIAWLARPASASPRRMFSDLRHALRWSRDGKTLDAEAFAALSDADDAPIERLDRLLARVARHYGVTVPRMKKRDRRRSLLWPRQVGMYLVRQASGWSLPRVGAYFGGFDHTTVGHACRQVEARIAATVGLARELDELLELSG
jgi:chromosomal replication initiator protein